jgi:phosphatidylglycerophosphate synthase
MDPIPDRPRVASAYRALASLLEEWVVLPDISPAYYHTLAVLLSVLFLYVQAPLQKALIIGVVLLTDWLDGATARRYNQVQRSGYITDVVTDRISEAFIFFAEVETVLGQIFFLLWMINSVLTFYSVYSNKHLSLPLRFSYMLVLITQGCMMR